MRMYTFHILTGSRKENIFNSPPRLQDSCCVEKRTEGHGKRIYLHIRHVGCSSFDGYGSIGVKRTIEAILTDRDLWLRLCTWNLMAGQPSDEHENELYDGGSHAGSLSIHRLRRRIFAMP